MITRRDFWVAAGTAAATVSIAAFAQTAAKPVMHSRVFQWRELKPQKTGIGEVRAVFDAATATLARFDCHVTTLNPGESPHPPHRHPEEELMILKEGTLEVLQNNATNRLDTGGIIFCASNELHGLRNIGTNRATYYVIKWHPHDLAQPGAK